MSHNQAKEFGITKIINYLRKSRQDIEMERKTGEDTLDAQKKLMDRVLAEYGIPYDQEPEIGSGDKISARPVFQRIIKEIENDKYDAISVKEISRMGRGSYTDMGTIYDLIVDKRLFIITPWKIYDPTNPTDLRQIRFELFMSREEFETTRERLTGGRYNAALEGKWVAGRAPFGYDYNPETKRLVINEKEAEMVRAIYDFYANGIVLNNGKRKLVQFRALSTYLKRIGIKTVRGKDEWHPVRLREFLCNDRYIGTIRFNTMMTTGDGKRIPRPENEHIIVKDAHPPVIDMETWEKVQDRMDNRTGTTNTKLDFDPCELAGLCVCVKCGRKMVRQYSVQNYKKKDGTTTKYHKEFLWCTTAGCTFVKYRSIEEDLLEVLNYLSNVDSKLLESHINNMVVQEKKDSGMTREDIEKNIQMRREDLERRMDFIYDKYESGIYDDNMFLKRKTEIDKEKEELSEFKVEEHVESEHVIDPEEIKDNIYNVLERYKNTEHKSNRNKILRDIFHHVDVEIIEKGRGRRPAVHQITPHLKSSFVSAKGI